jgi:hypothetical protein
MHVLRRDNSVPSSYLGDSLLAASCRLLSIHPLRKRLFRLLDRGLAARGKRKDAIGWQRTLIYRAVLHTVDRLIERRTLSPQVMQRIVNLWGRTLLVPMHRRQAASQFRQEHGCLPPWFLVLSPGHACNLDCPGCYASSGQEGAKLPWSMLDRYASPMEGVTTEAALTDESYAERMIACARENAALSQEIWESEYLRK